MFFKLSGFMERLRAKANNSPYRVENEDVYVAIFVELWSVLRLAEKAMKPGCMQCFILLVSAFLATVIVWTKFRSFVSSDILERDETQETLQRIEDLCQEEIYKTINDMNITLQKCKRYLLWALRYSQLLPVHDSIQNQLPILNAAVSKSIAVLSMDIGGPTPATPTGESPVRRPRLSTYNGISHRRPGCRYVARHHQLSNACAF